MKTYQTYLIKILYKKILIVSVVFFSLIIILNIFEEVNFFKDSSTNIVLPFFVSLLNAPSNLFEIFPFIFLISTQFFFLELISKNELETLKVHGLNNFKIIRLLFLSSFVLGILFASIFYDISARLNFLYFNIKNSYSLDSKYLAVVTRNGLWIKDEIIKKKYIINAAVIENKFLKNVVISEFNENFDLISVIRSDKVDISNFEWEVYLPNISKNNKTEILNKNIFLITHFDSEKINSLYRNLTSLTVFELIKLEKDYESIGYSTNDIKSHLHRIASFPLYLTILTILMSIIMLNAKKNRSFIYHIIFGIFLSVVIYYLYYLFNLLGKNNTIPVLLSIWLPLLLLTIFIAIGLIRINEK